MLLTRPIEGSMPTGPEAGLGSLDPPSGPRSKPPPPPGLFLTWSSHTTLPTQMLPPASRHTPPQAQFPMASASPREQTRPSLRRGGSDLTPRGPAESWAEGGQAASSPQCRALARPLVRGTGGGCEGFHALPSPPGGPGPWGVGRGTEFTAHPHCPARQGLSIRHARPVLEETALEG